jgi:1-deoxy-D-xylulose 5-phosphate reductoisomerase
MEYFLEGKIKYIEIAKVIERCLNQIRFNSTLSYDSLVELDQQTRDYARTICQHGTTT